MTRLFATPTLLAVLGLAGACAPAAPSPPDPAALEAAGNALDQQFVAAFNAHDADALTGLYWNSSDAVKIPPDPMLHHGIDAIRTANAQMLSTLGSANARLEATESHQMVVGEVVLGWGRWTLTTQGPDGQPTPTSGHYSNVKAERDGRWVYLLDHTSIPVPSETGAPTAGE